MLLIRRSEPAVELPVTMQSAVGAIYGTANMKLRSFALAAAIVAGMGATTVNAADIVDTAVGAGSFKTLVAAVQAAGLADTLKGPGPFTVFAPTDEAFAALPAGTVENLLKPENKDQLVAILTYHVVGRELTSNMLPGRTIHVKPLNTSARMLQVTKGDNGVTINGATVVAADIKADNGVIHVIDAVILPKM